MILDNNFNEEFFSKLKSINKMEELTNLFENKENIKLRDNFRR